MIIERRDEIAGGWDETISSRSTEAMLREGFQAETVSLTGRVKEVKRTHALQTEPRKSNNCEAGISRALRECCFYDFCA